jgi:hypothetical protein
LIGFGGGVEVVVVVVEERKCVDSKEGGRMFL